MKKITLLFTAIILGLATMAQAPAGINYQTVIRDGDGNILPDTELSLQMTIRSGAPDGEVVYAETHAATTNTFGLVNLVIGYGVPQTNAFADINWGSAEKYLEIAIDLTGGDDFTILGVTQFLSVPFAFHAQTTETFAETDPEFNAWDKSTGISITENQITDLQDYLTEEVDPEFNAWDKSTGISITENQITDLQDYLTEEVDPEFNAWDKSTGIAITENQITDLQDYLTEEIDPEFNAWDKSTGIAIAENQITDLQDYLTEEIDGDPTNELQSISQDGLEVTLSQGGGTFSVADNDNDAENELQTLEEQDYQVTLSQGGGTFMTGVKSYTQAEIEAMTPYNGLTVINTTTNCVNYYVLNNWFEACGTCTPQPTQAAAGDDQSFTDNTTATTLAANTPEYGTGLWTVESGEGGSFDYASLPDATFTGQPCTDYTLAWSITNTCGSTADQVEVSFFAIPTVADAGNDTIVSGGDLSVNLNANTPETDEGLWTILVGEGGTFDNATSPQTLFTGLPYMDYTLQWTISTPCDTATDVVTVAFKPCGMPFTDTRDGQSYETVLIGGQCWMAENLNIGNMITGGSNMSNNGTIEKYCYNNSTSNCDVYGGLYQWNEMMDYTTNAGVQGICMEGWHLPADAEWAALTTYLGGASIAGGKMKETGLTHWNSPNTGATNSSGFTGLPGGGRSTIGTFGGLGGNGSFWSSSEGSATNAWHRYLGYSNAVVDRYIDSKAYGFSARCLRD